MASLIQTENFQINSAEETIALGERLAAFLEKGSVVALRGPLGAGKTCFVKGIAKGLGVSCEVTSPTYTIISEYEAHTGPFYHIDAYRLTGNEDFSAIGGEEVIFGSGISVIEWSEHIPGCIPPEAFRVDIEIKSGNQRTIRIRGGGK